MAGTDAGAVKGFAIITATAALALMPQAAVAKKPSKAKDRGAKVERTKKDTAQQRCRDERKALGAAGFAAKYGKARTKGSAKAKAKAARASFGRCVSQTTKLIGAEREAAEEEQAVEDEQELEGEGSADGEDVLLDDPAADEAQLPHDGRHGDDDLPGGKHADDDDDEDEDEDEDDADEPVELDDV